MTTFRPRSSPKFSILIPVFETPLAFLSQALRSIECQQGLHEGLCEVIVVQDGDPRTFAPLDSQSQLGMPFKVLSLAENRGLSAARNAAIRRSRGEYVVLLDADDLLAPDCLQQLLQHLDESPADVLTSNSTRFIDDPEHPVALIDSSRYYQLYKEYYGSPLNPIFHSVFWIHVFCVRRETAIQLGGFRETLRCGELTDFMIRAHVSGASIEHVDKALYNYRTGGVLSKHPHIHQNRMAAMTTGFESYFNSPILSIEPLGRVQPVGNFHYNLTSSVYGPIRLPYVDYEHLCLKEEA